MFFNTLNDLNRMELNCTLFKYSGSKTVCNARMNCKTKLVMLVILSFLLYLLSFPVSRGRSSANYRSQKEPSLLFFSL